MRTHALHFSSLRDKSREATLRCASARDSVLKYTCNTCVRRSPAAGHSAGYIPPLAQTTRQAYDFGHFWPIFDLFWPLLGPLLTVVAPPDRPKMAHLGPFWAPFWPSWGPKSPQNEGGTGQNAPKMGVNHPKMRFGAILDHLKVTFIHFGPFLKVKIFSVFTRFWSLLAHFWPFLAHFGPPFDPPGAPDRPKMKGEPAKMPPKWV